MATLNINSGIITIIGQTQDGMDTIAFGEAATIPGLSGTGSFVLAPILLASVLFVLKRRGEVLEPGR